MQMAAPDEDYQAVNAHFNEKEFSELTIAIALMNALNRLAIVGRMAPQAARF